MFRYVKGTNELIGPRNVVTYVPEETVPPQNQNGSAQLTRI